eukprot:648812-Amphidinium_carterae.1
MFKQLGRRTFGTLVSTPRASVPAAPLSGLKASLTAEEPKGAALDVVDLLDDPDHSALSVTFRNGTKARFSALWLRDNCPKFSVASHREYAISGEHDAFQKATVRKDGTVLVDWKDGHFSLFPPGYLHKWSTTNVAKGEAYKAKPVSVGNPAPEVEYSSLEDPKKLYAAMQHVNDVG